MKPLKQNRMKTAVEWLVQQLTEVDYNCINKTFLQNDKSLAGYKMRELFEQAKEMEKEQIIEAYETAMETDIYNEPLKIGKDYFNQTFKSE
jgi:hypothetical protein